MTPTQPPLVVLVAYRSEKDMPDCLGALGGACPAVVVDNSSSAETATAARAAGATYLDAGGNLGFAAGVNLALRKAWDGHSDVLLLNPDARISGEAIMTLTRALHADARRAAVGPRLRTEDGRAQHADWPMPSPAQVWLEAVGLTRLWRGRRFVTGAVLLLRGQALAELGGLDERYFLYAEETDWQLHAQEAGWSVAVVPEAVAIHVGGASSSDPALRERTSHASAELFARRWYGPRGWALMRAAAALTAARRVMLAPPDKRRAARHSLQLLLRGPVAQAAAHGAEFQ